MDNGIAYDFIYTAGDNETFDCSNEFFNIISTVVYPTEEEIMEKYVY